MATRTPPRAFPSFDPVPHVMRVDADSVGGMVRVVGIDVGSRSPCVALHGVLAADDRVTVYREHWATDACLGAMIEHRWLKDEWGCPVVAGEQALKARSPLDGRTGYAMLTRAGHAVALVRSRPADRVAAIRQRLDRGDGPGGLVLDRSCVRTVAALIGHRQHQRGLVMGEASTPEHQHAIDALGYMVCVLDVMTLGRGYAGDARSVDLHA